MYRGRCETYTTTQEVSIAQSSVSQPSAAVPIIGTGEQALNPVTFGASFVSVLNEYVQTLVTGSAIEIMTDGRARALRAGIMTVTGYADVSHTLNNATVGIVFTILRGGVTTLSPRTVHGRVPSIGDIGNISVVGTLAVEVGDIIGIAVASSLTGAITIHSSSLVFRLD